MELPRSAQRVQALLAAAGSTARVVALSTTARTAATFVDADLAPCEPIWAAAGHPQAVFPIAFEELVRLTAGTVVAVI